MGKSGYIGDYRYLDYADNMTADPIKNVLELDSQDILQTCLKEVRETLTKHKDLFIYFAEELLKKEELEYDEIEAIFNKFGVTPFSRPADLNS